MSQRTLNKVVREVNGKVQDVEDPSHGGTIRLRPIYNANTKEED